ncbi:hypothetical protein TEK04_10610 [Klenkia sp. LSe6-5]|uniref:Uncharacterized protein n=1 Tax=Klenkia sesuvii TaxID=3103137 RepID=A0ABU8DTZ1_9ACTN
MPPPVDAGRSALETALAQLALDARRRRLLAHDVTTPHPARLLAARRGARAQHHPRTGHGRPSPISLAPR